jgi:superfamily II DNA or RNA helicase
MTPSRRQDKHTQMLHKSQQAAIKTSIDNDFASGIHAHATGTGKSWIALQLVLEFHRRNPTKNIAWICEQKFILTEQFDRETLKQKGFTAIHKHFLVINYTEQKPSSWTQLLASALIWKKPILLIINRAFLTSQQRYKQLRVPFGLIIHDECHSITNKSTREFYEFVSQTSPQTRIIGFTATPTTTHPPFTTILSQYSIYDAVCDKVILPPRIHWLKSTELINTYDILQVYKLMTVSLPYKKTIVWCGMIQNCDDLATQWQNALPTYDVYVDTSASEEGGYESFAAAKSHAILFCAAKHREGSDIPRLDSCVFLDQVEDRNAKTFVQCVGRVLRQAPRKTYGVVLDISASSSIRICDRLNEYLNSSSGSTGTSGKTAFPFSYKSDDIHVNGKPIQVNTLTMVTVGAEQQQAIPKEPLPKIESLFTRHLPQTQAYQKRLQAEIALINEKNLMGYIFQALEILAIAGNVPHVTRGSCGSSLLCYALGISNVDPVTYGISFARFLTPYRSNLPDIDYDFPYNRRDEIFLQVQLKWPNKVARISNHVYYHAPSALREAVRRAGLKPSSFAGGKKYDLAHYVSKLPQEQKTQIQKTSKGLEKTFKCYSLHCGGIVFYPEGVPQALRLKNARSNTLAQVKLNKHDVAKEQNFKIDILSSRALAQLYEASGFKQLRIEDFTYDQKTFDMLCRGDNIGITLAESPLIRSAFLKVQPRCIGDIAMCLAIIRPAARDVRKLRKEKLSECLNAEFIYDDDAIRLIAETLNIEEDKADYFRRGLTKGDAKVQAEFTKSLRVISLGKAQALQKKLRNLRAYGFCKSHAYSYAQLVYHLAYYKANKPEEFWKAALKHSQSSYRKWVLPYEAFRSGVTVQKQAESIYATNRRRGQHTLRDSLQSPEEQLRRTGIWSFDKYGFIPGCYAYTVAPNQIAFRGIIASSRVLSAAKASTSALFLCVGPGKYINISLKGRARIGGKIGIQGFANKVDIQDELIFTSEQGMYSGF